MTQTNLKKREIKKKKEKKKKNNRHTNCVGRKKLNLMRLLRLTRFNLTPNKNIVNRYIRKALGIKKGKDFIGI